MGDERNVEDLLSQDIIETGLVALSELEPGSEEYIKLAQAIRELYKLRNENERFNFEAYQKQEEFEFSKKKFETETTLKTRELDLKEKEIAVDAKKSSIDADVKKKASIVTIVVAAISGGVSLFQLAFNSKWLKDIMKFEETGSITSKAFGFIGKIPLFRKN